MKVILQQNVSHVGEKYDVVDVSDGYARNFLLPRELAHRATAEDMKRTEERRAREEEKRQQEEVVRAEKIGEIHGMRINTTAPADEKGHLYAGIHVADVISLIEDKTGYTFPEECITYNDPIKEIGEHQITIHSHDSQALITIGVEKEK